MRDKFIFSNGQDLGSLSTTGVIADYFYDLEYDDNDVLIKADQYVEFWLNMIILTCTQTSGNEGMEVEVRISDNSDCTTSHKVIAGFQLLEAELVAGNMYSVGVSRHVNLRYLAPWYCAHTSALNNATTIDCWMANHPITSPTYRCQKRPA